MRTCCHLVHHQCPATSSRPAAQVLEGAAVPAAPQPVPSTADGVAESLLVWLVGVFAAAALLAVIAANVPLLEVLEALG